MTFRPSKLSILAVFAAGCGPRPAIPPSSPAGSVPTLHVSDPRMKKMFELFHDDGIRYVSLTVSAPKRGGVRTVNDPGDILEATGRLVDILWLRKPLPPVTPPDLATFTWEVKEEQGRARAETVAFTLSGTDGYSKTVRSVVEDVFKGKAGAPIRWTPQPK